MGWADEFRGKFGVRANADIPRDAKAARTFGAEGIGLCRTEHMFFAEDRIDAHAGHDSGARRKDPPQGAAEAAPHAAHAISPACSRPWTDFPVVIRTLDPPLHEFLPKREDLMVDIAILPYADIKKKKELVAKY